MKSRRVLLAGTILAAAAGVILFVFSTTPAVPAPASADPPPITWTPKKLFQPAVPGFAFDLPVSFTSSVNLENIVVRVVPELQPYLRVEPTSFTSVRAREPTTIILRFAPSSETPPGTKIDGTVQLKKLRSSGKPGSTDNVPYPLPIMLEIFSQYAPTLTDQVRESSLVLIGTVAAVRYAYHETYTNILFTYSTITPSRLLKGSPPGSSIIVRTLGGRAANRRLGPNHIALKVGEEVLLILDGPDPENYTVPGDPPGVFHIENDPARGKLAVIDPSYAFREDGNSWDPAMDVFLDRSAQRAVSLDELITTLGFTP